MGTLAKRVSDPRWHSFSRPLPLRDEPFAAALGGYMPRWPIAAVILSLSIALLPGGARNAHGQFVLTSTNELGLGSGPWMANPGEFDFYETLDIPLVALGGHNGGVAYGISDTSNLIDLTGAGEITVGPLGHDILSLAFQTDGPSTVFGTSYQDLYAINLSTAATTLIGHMGNFAESGLIGTAIGYADTLFLAEQNGAPMSSLYTVDKTTGLASLVGPIGFAVTSLFDENDGLNEALYGFTPDGKIILINSLTGAGTFLANETTSPNSNGLLTGVIIGASSDALAPEPSSLILAAFGGLALLAHCWRK
jgi:hypothetical protein